MPPPTWRTSERVCNTITITMIRGESQPRTLIKGQKMLQALYIVLPRLVWGIPEVNLRPNYTEFSDDIFHSPQIANFLSLS